MKNHIIFLMLAACVVAIQACAPKAVIPSAARLSKKEYLQAIKTERKARQVLKTKAIAKQNNYYAFEKNLSRTNDDPDKTASIIDSLVNMRRFMFWATSGVVDGENLSNYGSYGGQYKSPVYFRGDTLVLSLSYPFIGPYSISEYKNHNHYFYPPY